MLSCFVLANIFQQKNLLLMQYKGYCHVVTRVRLLQVKLFVIVLKTRYKYRQIVSERILKHLLVATLRDIAHPYFPNHLKQSKYW